MAAEKVVPRRSSKALTWAVSAAGHRFWRGPVEVNGAQVGQIYLHANPEHERSWYFKFLFKGGEVYTVDVQPGSARHCNTGCPPQFPGKVRTKEHEHVYIEGLGCHCAQPLNGLGGASYSEVLGVFCERAKIEFRPNYEAPLRLTQPRLI